MKLAEPVALRTWEAALELTYASRDGRSVLMHRSSRGPLAVQKSLYPEGGGVCHTILLHPPGGIAGGDRLAFTINLRAQAHAFLTTPGATKWYRSAALGAEQRVEISVDSGCVCEWFPQENIFYDAANASNALSVALSPGAFFCGWDVICLGRTASGERFRTGFVRQNLRIAQGGRPLFEELGKIKGGSALLDSPAGMAGLPACGIFLLAGMEVRGEALEACRAIVPVGDGKWGITSMQSILAARYLGRSAQAARDYFARIWEVVRPMYARRAAQAPRIWAT